MEEVPYQEPRRKPVRQGLCKDWHVGHVDEGFVVSLPLHLLRDVGDVDGKEQGEHGKVGEHQEEEEKEDVKCSTGACRATGFNHFHGGVFDWKGQDWEGKG